MGCQACPAAPGPRRQRQYAPLGGQPSRRRGGLRFHRVSRRGQLVSPGSPAQPPFDLRGYAGARLLFQAYLSQSRRRTVESRRAGRGIRQPRGYQLSPAASRCFRFVQRLASHAEATGADLRSRLLQGAVSRPLPRVPHRAAHTRLPVAVRGALHCGRRSAAAGREGQRTGQPAAGVPVLVRRHQGLRRQPGLLARRRHGSRIAAREKPPGATMKKWLIAGLFTLASSTALAQDYPSKPIRLIIPYAAGSVAEVLFRSMMPALEPRLGQRFIIDARPGADGNIGMAEAARAAPDGYTLLLAPTANFAVLDHLAKNLPFNALTSFEPVSMIAETWPLCTVGPDVPARNLKELADYVKANPGKYNYGSQGTGSPTHLIGA